MVQASSIGGWDAIGYSVAFLIAAIAFAIVYSVLTKR